MIRVSNNVSVQSGIAGILFLIAVVPLLPQPLQ
jgi:hypothetical protein